ncbi:MAG: S-layer homology domain-containing protein [Acidimicrobiales bacterium]
MSTLHSNLRRAIAAAVVVAVVFAVSPAAAVDETEAEQVLLAPFACGTEWQGTTYSGHGHDDLTLDLNRTSLVWPDPLHDLDQPILAQGDGVVVHVAQDGWNSGAGTYLEVDYGDVTAVYVHLVENSIAVELHDTVTTGDLLGLLGNTGNIFSSTAEKLAHLHLAYWDSSGAEDSRSYLLDTQIPVRIDGVDYIATAEPRSPAPPFVSTNCDGAPIPATPAPRSEPTPPAYPFSDIEAGSFAYDDIALLYELAITEGTGPESYAPDRTVDREQMAAFLARIWRLMAPDTPAPEGDYPFDDVDTDSFAYDDIALLFELGITTGTGQTTYSPGRSVSREQMAAFLSRIHEKLAEPALAAASALPAEPDTIGPGPIFADYPFDDVEPGSFAYGDIAQIHQLGITTGTSATTYSPAQTVDREQMAAFLARVYRLLETTE